METISCIECNFPIVTLCSDNQQIPQHRQCRGLLCPDGPVTLGALGAEHVPYKSPCYLFSFRLVPTWNSYSSCSGRLGKSQMSSVVTTCPHSDLLSLGPMLSTRIDESFSTDPDVGDNLQDYIESTDIY
jgi:hypothetical protein